MGAARAARLGRRAGRRRSDGSRGLLARRAWRALVRAGDKGQHAAIDAVWELWLQDPQDDSWELLTRWRDEPELMAAVFGAAMDPDRHRGSRATIGAFCGRHGLVPDETIDRALFFVLTGQPAASRALDPDGSLLAAGYRSADVATRAALRGAIVGTGDLDLVRVVTERRDRDMSDEEVDDVIRHLTHHQEWERLWRLVSGLHLDRAAAAMPLFADWRPADAPSRALFDRLTHVDPTAISSLVHAASIRIETGRQVQSGSQLSFAPDMSEIAVVDGIELRVHSVPDMRTVASFTLPPSRHDGADDERPGAVVHLGEELVYKEASGPVVSRHRPQWSREVVANWRGAELAPVKGGFVCSGGVVMFGAPGGALTQPMAAQDLGLLTHDAQYVSVLATEPARGLTVVHTFGQDPQTYEYFTTGVVLAVLDAERNVVARTRCASRKAWFVTPERLLVQLHAGWKLLERREGDLREVRLDEPLGLDVELTPLPALGVIAVRDDQTDEPTWRHAATLAPVGPPPALGWDVPSCVLPGGTHAVFSVDGGVEVRDLRLLGVADLVRRPLAELRPGDLRAVEEAAARGLDDDVRALVDLLRACLEHRFSTEVALGEAAPVTGGETDIALGGHA